MTKTIPLLILVTALAGGCVTKVETVVAPHPESSAGPDVPPANDNRSQTSRDRRIFIDPALARVIRIVRSKSETSPEGFLKIQVNVQNLTDASQQFTYRVEWLDKDGETLKTAISTPFPWLLIRRETSFLAATAPSPSAKDYRVIFVPDSGQ